VSIGTVTVGVTTAPVLIVERTETMNEKRELRTARAWIARGSFMNLMNVARTKVRVYARPYSKTENCQPVVILEYEDGRVGDFTPEMVEKLRELDAETQTGFFYRKSMWGMIADAISGVLREGEEK
jgi:hypothetical protein